MKQFWFRLLACERGATAIEYAMIASLISIAIVAAVQSLGIKLNGTFEDVVAGF